MFLIGSEMDYQEDKFQSGFTFSNPNEKGRCGCGAALLRYCNAAQPPRCANSSAARALPINASLSAESGVMA